MKVQLKIFNHGFIEEFGQPSYATKGSGALDLRVIVDQNTITLNPNECKKFKCGIGIYLKDDRYVALIYPRSGLGSKGLVLGNGVGVIDSDYQGELILALWNRSHEPIEINHGDRVAQLIIQKIKKPSFEIVNEYETKTERNISGFGSTGL